MSSRAPSPMEEDLPPIPIPEYEFLALMGILIGITRGYDQEVLGTNSDIPVAEILQEERQVNFRNIRFLLSLMSPGAVDMIMCMREGRHPTPEQMQNVPQVDGSLGAIGIYHHLAFRLRGNILTLAHYIGKAGGGAVSRTKADWKESKVGYQERIASHHTGSMLAYRTDQPPNKHERLCFVEWDEAGELYMVVWVAALAMMPEHWQRFKDMGPEDRRFTEDQLEARVVAIVTILEFLLTSMASVLIHDDAIQHVAVHYKQWLPPKPTAPFLISCNTQHIITSSVPALTGEPIENAHSIRLLLKEKWGHIQPPPPPHPITVARLPPHPLYHPHWKQDRQYNEDAVGPPTLTFQERAINPYLAKVEQVTKNDPEHLITLEPGSVDLELAADRLFYMNQLLGGGVRMAIDAGEQVVVVSGEEMGLLPLSVAMSVSASGVQPLLAVGTRITIRVVSTQLSFSGYLMSPTTSIHIKCIDRVLDLDLNEASLKALDKNYHTNFFPSFVAFISFLNNLLNHARFGNGYVELPPLHHLAKDGWSTVDVQYLSGPNNMIDFDAWEKAAEIKRREHALDRQIEKLDDAFKKELGNPTPGSERFVKVVCGSEMHMFIKGINDKSTHEERLTHHCLSEAKRLYTHYWPAMEAFGGITGFRSTLRPVFLSVGDESREAFLKALDLQNVRQSFIVSLPFGTGVMGIFGMMILDPEFGKEEYPDGLLNRIFRESGDLIHVAILQLGRQHIRGNRGSFDIKIGRLRSIEVDLQRWTRVGLPIKPEGGKVTYEEFDPLVLQWERKGEEMK